MGDADNSLMERQVELDGAVKDVSVRIRNQKRRARRTAMRAQTISARLARIIWIMFGLATDPRGAVLHVMRHSKERRRFVGVTDRALLEIAERSFLDADINEIASLMAGERSERSNTLRTAERYLAEWELFAWCTNLNEASGIAPSTHAFLRRARMYADALPAVVFQVTSSGRPALPARKWAERWRKRWCARLGRLQARENYSVSELRQKVPSYPFSYHADTLIALFVRAFVWISSKTAPRKRAPHPTKCLRRL